MSDNPNDLQQLVDACTREAARLRQEAEKATTDAELIRRLEQARYYDHQAVAYAKQLQPGRRSF